MMARRLIARLPASLLELVLVGVLALAVGKDVSEAQAKCNTAFQCSAECANTPGPGSHELVETTKRFTTGNQSLRCGDDKTFPRPACKGNPIVLPASCASNCCK